MSHHLFTYAVGDIYGDHALLTSLLDRIHDHAEGEDYRLVFLGNTIDHGPNGNAVLSALRSMELRAPDRVITLRGWHEALMTEARGEAEAFATWLSNGGEATLRSFGVKRHAELPREVVDWVARRPSEFRDGLRRFVSDASLAAENEGSARAATSSPQDLHLVHGSSGAREAGRQGLPLQAVGRTDIDTGAGFGGPLTAAVFTDLQASPAGFFQALVDGTTRFLPPDRSMAQPWDPRLALKIADGEPEGAAAWALRQDADMIAAQLAHKKRTGRRRTALAAAAGLVVVVGGTGILLRPAMTFLARTMAPADGRQDVAALVPPVPSSLGGGGAVSTDAPAQPSVTALPADTTADLQAPPETVPEGPMRTHALPQPGAEPRAADEPSSTASMTPAPAAPSASPLSASPAEKPAPATNAASSIPALPQDPAQPDPAPFAGSAAGNDTPVAAMGEATPAEVHALPALALADGVIGGGLSADDTSPIFVLPKARPESITPFRLALDPSRRIGWSAEGASGGRGLAGLGLSREASISLPVLGSGLLSEDVVSPPAKAALRARAKPRPKPKALGLQHPAGRKPPALLGGALQDSSREAVGVPDPAAPDGVTRGGPIDLRALMDAPRAPRTTKRPPARPAPRSAAPVVEPEPAGQP